MNPSSERRQRQKEHPAAESQSTTGRIYVQQDIKYSGTGINPTRCLELIPEYFDSQRVLPARYTLITSPFSDMSGGNSVGIDNYEAGRAVWKQFCDRHKDIAASRAFAADAVALTHLDRSWLLAPPYQGESIPARAARLNNDLLRIKSSGWELGIELLASRCGIQIEKLVDSANPLALWTLLPPEKKKASPVNLIAELLQRKLNISTYIKTINCHGVYFLRDREAERAGVIVFSPACFTDSPGDFMNTWLHETIHGIFDIDLKTSASLTTYRGQRKDRGADLGAYDKYLQYDEILAHVGGTLFLPVSGIAADSNPQKHSSVHLLDQLVKDSKFMAHVLAQYDFSKRTFDNGNRGTCSASITLSRGSDNSIELTVKLCGEHHLELTREQHARFAPVLGYNPKIDLMNIFEKHPQEAKELLKILQERIKSCGEAAEIGREIIVDLARLGASISGDPSQFSLPDVLAHARQRVLTLPGLKQLFDSIPDLLDLFEGAYRQVAGFEN
jgi:hypothetical protein